MSDQIPWDDLDEDTSIKIGILSELTAIREQLQRIGTALEDDDESPTTLHCKPCGTYISEFEAEAHAVNEHNAHPEDDFRATLYEEVA